MTREEERIQRSFRKEKPAHYTVKIKSFSSVLNSSFEKYVCGDFEAGGYKWRLTIYPKGNVERNGKDHLSLYLAMSEADSLPAGWELYVILRLFIYEQFLDKFLMVQDSHGKTRRFHSMKTEWGLPQFMSLNTFKDPSRGYLVEDTCYFGAEIFICGKNNCAEGKAKAGECLATVNEPLKYIHTWKIMKFSGLVDKKYFSQVFTAGGYQWKILVFPNGFGSEENRSLSLYLIMADKETLQQQTVQIEFVLRVRDQVSGKHSEKKAIHGFNSWGHVHGWISFMPLSDLNDLSNDFLVDDVCIIEAQLTLPAVVTNSSQN
ncbi:PREDICTED: uncharacterized protein LOC104609120 [Nelumbo nucifera]|uniref:Uncharacterized protein LOC104609120 n=1 Tax=Nelumbo nucifera TaxID=4432 RepID=A0A1U8BBR4_NELNU|nr:PREDICTED: uncharacterized protein LOC104609120 [Nelumbo nucifera]